MSHVLTEEDLSGPSFVRHIQQAKVWISYEHMDVLVRHEIPGNGEKEFQMKHPESNKTNFNVSQDRMWPS